MISVCVFGGAFSFFFEAWGAKYNQVLLKHFPRLHGPRPRLLLVLEDPKEGRVPVCALVRVKEQVLVLVLGSAQLIICFIIRLALDS